MGDRAISSNANGDWLRELLARFYIQFTAARSIERATSSSLQIGPVLAEHQHFDRHKYTKRLLSPRCLNLCFQSGILRFWTSVQAVDCPVGFQDNLVQQDAVVSYISFKEKKILFSFYLYRVLLFFFFFFLDHP